MDSIETGSLNYWLKKLAIWAAMAHWFAQELISDTVTRQLKM